MTQTQYARQSGRRLSVVAYAIGLKLAIELHRWDDAREQLDGLLDALVAAEAQIPTVEALP